MHWKDLTFSLWNYLILPRKKSSSEIPKFRYELSRSPLQPKKNYVMMFADRILVLGDRWWQEHDLSRGYHPEGWLPSRIGTVPSFVTFNGDPSHFLRRCVQFKLGFLKFKSAHNFEIQSNLLCLNFDRAGILFRWGRRNMGKYFGRGNWMMIKLEAPCLFLTNHSVGGSPNT